MTARPVDSDNWRRPVYAEVALVLVMVAVLLAAGCVNQTPTKNQTYSPTTAFTNTPADITAPVTIIPTATPIPSNPIPPSIYWIKVDPISDKQIGEIFTITSTTNLSVGDDIEVRIYSVNFKPPQRGESGSNSGVTGVVKVIPGRNGINTVSFTVESSDFFLPDEYYITENAIHKNAFGYTRFNFTQIKHVKE